MTIAQTDSLALEKFYLQKADSLFERGEYEAARTYFWSAQEYPYSAKEAKEKANFYIEINRKIDVAITYNLTDSIKYKYRMEEGYRWLKFKDTVTSMSYFLEANRLFPQNPEPMKVIKSVLDLPHQRMDTVVLSNKGSGKFLFLSKRPLYGTGKKNIIGYRFFYPNYNLINLQIDTVLCLKDSLPFNGVLISERSYHSEFIGGKPSRYFSSYRFEHGMNVSQTDYYLCKSETPERLENPLKHFVSLEQGECICRINTTYDSIVEEIWYHESGDLGGKSFTSRGGATLYEAVSYSVKNDTTGFSYRRYSEDSLYLITFSKEFFESGQLKSFSYTKETPDGKELADEFFERDDRGDTLNYIRFNADDNTEITARQWDDAAHLLYLCYRKGDSLVGIPTPRMLFLDEKYQIISESEFVRCYNKQLLERNGAEPLFEAFEDIPGSEKEPRYLFYAYPKGIYGKETRRHYERIRKIQSNVEKE